MRRAGWPARCQRLIQTAPTGEDAEAATALHSAFVGLGGTITPDSWDAISDAGRNLALEASTCGLPQRIESALQRGR